MDDTALLRDIFIYYIAELDFYCKQNTKVKMSSRFSQTSRK